MPSFHSLARISAFGVVLFVGSSFRAQAVPMPGKQLDGPRHTYTYSTLATFSEGTVSSIPSVSFQGVQGQTVESAAPFLMGSFPYGTPPGSVSDFPLGKLIVTLPSIGSTVYDFAGYGITVRIEEVDGVKLPTPISTLLTGALKGVINASGESNLLFSIGGHSMAAPASPPGWIAGEFKYGELTNYILDFSHSTLDGVRFSSDMEFALTPQLMSATAVNTPEPATWAVFSMGAVAAWFAARQRASKLRAI